MRECWAALAIQIEEGEEVNPDRLTETGAYPIMALRGKGRGQEFSWIPENFGRTPRRTPRKLRIVPKPPKSEGIEDAPTNYRQAAHAASPPLVEALRQAAPNATTVILANGQVIPLAAAIEHARTCPLLAKTFTENKEVAKPKGNSSFLFLEQLNAAISPIFYPKKLGADTPLWNDIQFLLSGTPRQAFLTLVRAKVEEAKTNRNKFQKMGLLQELAKEAAADWKPLAPKYSAFEKLLAEGFDPLAIAEELGISDARAREWEWWLEGTKGANA